MSDRRDVIWTNIDQFWNNHHDPSFLTVLYYAFLLMRSQNMNKADIRSDLEKRVSIQHNTFDHIVRDFEYYGIISSAETCALTVEAMQKLDLLFESGFGGSPPPSFDGEKIFGAGKSQRQKLWVEHGVDYLIELFGNVQGMKQPQVISFMFNKGKILVLELDEPIPPLIFYFINTGQMTDLDREAAPLYKHALEIVNRRRQQIRSMSLTAEQVARSLNAIRIVAAPTYTTEVAQAARYGDPPTLLIGPINLELIGYYLECRAGSRDQHFRGIVDYLDPDSGWLPGGIIFHAGLKNYLEKYYT